MDGPCTQLIESDPRTPEFSTMVLLVDDQAIVAQAVRGLLAGLPDIDLHYCSDPVEAVKEANKIRPSVITGKTSSSGRISPSAWRRC